MIMNRQQSVEVEILLPVYNEAETIEATIREIYVEVVLSSNSMSMPRFSVCFMPGALGRGLPKHCRYGIWHERRT